jgi:hypothetical protein
MRSRVGLSEMAWNKDVLFLESVAGKAGAVFPIPAGLAPSVNVDFVCLLSRH